MVPLRRERMRARVALALSPFAILAPLLSLSPVRAQTVRTRVLEGLNVDEALDAFEIYIRFAVPINYLRHAPRGRGDTIDIQLAPLALGTSEQADFSQTLTVPPDFPVPITRVTYEGEAGRNALVEVRFSKVLRFQVKRGRDLRSLLIRVPIDDVRSRERPQAQSASPSGARVDKLMEAARSAMTAADYERAVLIYTKLLEMPENSRSPAAREFLGLARERLGQRAHAKAEYEQYLRLYPDGEGADRVRQRLDALVTARSEPPAPRPEPPQEKRQIASRTFGSLYVGYQRQSRLLDEEGEEVSDSSLFSDVFVDSRLTLESLVLRSQLSGGYRYDLLGGMSADATRVSSAFVSAEHGLIGFSGSLGRRSKTTGGVLGRYDGVELRQRIGRRWELGVIGGFPVDSTKATRMEFNRYFGGLSVDIRELLDRVDLEFFAIVQNEGDLLDRIAVGSEARYFSNGLLLASFLDYDVYYQSLNIAQLVGNWQLTQRTNLNTFLDYRNVPVLTTHNALQGQDADDLEDLLKLFSEDEIVSLAEDRTGRALTLNAGVSHSFTDSLQLAADFGTTEMSGTKTSGGVEGLEATGFEFSYSAQLIANGVVVPRDLVSVGLRYYDGSQVDIASLMFTSRLPVTRDFRISPRVRVQHRNERTQSDRIVVSPTLRFDYRLWKLAFDADLGIEWRVPLGSGLDRELAFFMTCGVRYDL
jgi:tetratricopeptide (TPR) repeat protein